MDETCINRIQFANVAAFLVSNGNRSILIDTGHPNTVDKFHPAIESAGILPENISLIILTHTHFDHCGGAEELKRICGAQLAVHRSEVDFLRKGRTTFPKGTRWKGKVLTFVGNILARRVTRYPPVVADLLIDDEMDLNDFGIPGRVIHTPGHTAGSVSILLDNGDAIVGDNVLGISVKEHFPPFANDKHRVIESWEKYINAGVKVIFPAHGRKVLIEALIKELPRARKKYL